MWRRLAFSAAALAIVLLPAEAAAKGSTLRFSEDRYAPGDRAVASADVETWPGSGQPDDAPFPVYLVRGGQPLWFGHLPQAAIRVGNLHIGDRLAEDEYRVSVTFEIPHVRDGRYSVWVCRETKGGAGAGCWIGFGDLTYGRVRVDAHRVSHATAHLRSGLHLLPPPKPTATDLWIALYLAAVAAVGVAVGVRARRPVRA